LFGPQHFSQWHCYPTVPTIWVTAFSWVTAIVEILADLTFGVVRVPVLRARRRTAMFWLRMY